MLGRDELEVDGVDNGPDLPRSLHSGEKIVLDLGTDGGERVTVDETKVSEEDSHKDGAPDDLIKSNLGCDGLAIASGDEVVEPVVNEAFVRNARWAIKKFPELADIQDGSNFSSGASSNADQKRLRLTFQANVVSLQLLSFHCTAADVVLADTGGNDAKSQAARLELVLGVPSSRAALRLQQATALLKTMDSWEQFFNDGVQLSPAPSSRFLAQWLRRAIDRSGARGYHNQRRALRLLRDKRIRHKLIRSNEESEENGKTFEYNDFAMAS